MEGIIFLVVLAFLIIPVVLLIMMSGVRGDLRQMRQHFDKKLDEVKGDALNRANAKVETGKFFTSPEDVVDTKSPPVQAKQAPKAAFPRSAVRPVQNPTGASKPAQQVTPGTPIQRPPVTSSTIEKAQNKGPAQVLHRVKKKRNWEKLIGENLLNKVGIAILVLGMGYLVRHAFAVKELAQLGNVTIGVLGGGVLLFLAHKLRDKMRAFSSVLAGGAVAIFYFTIAIAYKDYALISSSISGLLMLLTSGLAVALSLLWSRKELAVISLLGAFVTPAIISTGEGNLITLFGYITIINLGMLTLAAFKRWKLIYRISFVLTSFYVLLWIIQKGIETEGEALQLLAFSTLYFFIFFGQQLVYNLRKKRLLQKLDFLTLFGITGTFFGAAMFLLSKVEDGFYQGMFTAALAVVFLAGPVAFFQRRASDKNLFYLFIALALTMVSLVAPIQLNGYGITLFWASQAALMWWLAHKSKIRFVAQAAYAILGLMLVSLVWDWADVYYSQSLGNLAWMINKGFVTTIISLASLGFVTFWKSKHTFEPLFSKLPSFQWESVLRGLFFLLAYAGLSAELHYQLFSSSMLGNTVFILLGIYHLAVWLFVIRIFKNRGLSLPALPLAAMGLLTVFTYFSFFQNMTTGLRQDILRGTSEAWLGFALHYILLALVGMFAFVSYKALRKRLPQFQVLSKCYAVLGALALVVLSSIEFSHFAYFIHYNPDTDYLSAIRDWRRAGYAVLWSLIAGSFMFAGLKKKVRFWRVIGLVLFTLVIFKLFLIDFRGITEQGRIIAYICLGAFLLAISFMYQRLKEIIFDDDKKEELSAH